MHKKYSVLSILITLCVILTLCITRAAAAPSWTNEHTSEFPLYALWGFSGNSAFAGGLDGYLARYNGSQWARMQGPTANDIWEFWGTSEANLYAVCTGLGDEKIIRFDGQAWSAVAVPLPTDYDEGYGFNDIWGFSATEMYVAGSAHVYAFDGSSLTLMPAELPEGYAAPELYIHASALWGASGSQLFAVGDAIYHYDGDTWRLVKTLSYTNALMDVWGSSGQDVFAVGYSGTIMHYDGESWSAMSSGTTENLRGVWGTSGQDVYAVGDSGTVLHYDGGTWSPVAVAEGSVYLTSVQGTSASDIFITGTDNDFGFIYHYRDAAAGGTLTITAEPASLPTDGKSTTMISVSVKDGAGQPRAGETVFFDAPALGALSPLSGKTDLQGSFTTVYTAPSSDAAGDTAWVDLTARAPGVGLQGTVRIGLESTAHELHGTVTDAWNTPLQSLVVKLQYDGKEYETTTDEGGIYRIRFAGPYGKQAGLSFLMQCRDDEGQKIYFTITLDLVNPFVFEQDFLISGQEDLEHDFVAANQVRGSEYFGYLYAQLQVAAAFYEEVLGASVGEVLVNPFASQRSAYIPEARGIRISDDHTVYRDDLPIFFLRDVELHEYAHHVMHSLYGRLPEGPADATVKEINHGGYANPSTADSLVEGFAVFMPQVIKKFRAQAGAGIDSSKGNLELNIKAWEKFGYAEDAAVAAILWDLYDGIDPADNDTVQLSLQQIWDVLKTTHQHMYSVYRGFASDDPGLQAGIDRIFVNHGFFADKDPGNGRYDYHEPSRGKPTDQDFYFVDLAAPLQRDDNETIGQATNYQRPNRYYPPSDPGYFVKTLNSYPYYTVRLSFPDNPTLDHALLVIGQEGLVPVAMPPEAYQAVITIEGYGEGISTGRPLSFTNAEFIAGYKAIVGSGYFQEHDFDIEGTAPPRPGTDPALTGGGQCLATALLGAADPRLAALRRLRDEVLARSILGRQLISMYCYGSPQAIKIMERNPRLKGALKALLERIIPAILQMAP